MHPNDAGFQKMSDRWYPALTQLLSGGSPSPSASLSTSTSPSASGGSTGPSPSTSSSSATATCTATYAVANSWAGGFQGQVTVTNTGARPTTGWSVTWTFPNGQVISQVWGGTGAQTGTGVRVANTSWNGVLTSAATATVGFIASTAGTNQPPTDLACHAS